MNYNFTNTDKEAKHLAENEFNLRRNFIQEKIGDGVAIVFNTEEIMIAILGLDLIVIFIISLIFLNLALFFL